MYILLFVMKNLTLNMLHTIPSKKLGIKTRVFPYQHLQTALNYRLKLYAMKTMPINDIPGLTDFLEFNIFL